MFRFRCAPERAKLSSMARKVLRRSAMGLDLWAQAQMSPRFFFFSGKGFIRAMRPCPLPRSKFGSKRGSRRSSENTLAPSEGAPKVAAHLGVAGFESV